MKLIIDIPDEEYDVILANADFYKEKNWGSPIIWDAIVNCTPLPENEWRYETRPLTDKDLERIKEYAKTWRPSLESYKEGNKKDETKM